MQSDQFCILCLAFWLGIIFFNMTPKKSQSERKKFFPVTLPLIPAIRYIQCLLMPNGEVLFRGKTLGFVTNKNDSNDCAPMLKTL